MMKPGSGLSQNGAKNGSDKKRRRKPTLESGSKKVKAAASSNSNDSGRAAISTALTLDIGRAPLKNSNQQAVNYGVATSNRLSTPTSQGSVCLSPSTLAFPSTPTPMGRVFAPSTSTAFDASTVSKQLYDDSYYNDRCYSPTAASKLSISSDEEYSYESNSDEDSDSCASEDESSTIAPIVEKQEFIIWDPLNDKNSTVSVSREEAEDMMAQQFGYSTVLTRKIQSLSAICSCELLKL